MPQGLSASRQPPSSDLPEYLSSSPPQRAPPSLPTDEALPPDPNDDFPKPPLPERPARLKSDSRLSGMKSTWNLIYSMKKKPDTQGSSEAGNTALDRTTALGTPASHEIELHISPPSSLLADLSAGELCESEQQPKSKSSYFNRKKKSSVPVDNIEALEGESIATRHNMGTASIDCEFYKIEYGQFKERPACMIIVDVRLVYTPDDAIKTTKIELQFAKDVAQILSPDGPKYAQSTKAPISKVFAPKYIVGMPTNIHVSKHHHIRPKLEGASFKIDVGGGGGRETSIDQYLWRVVGSMEEHNGIDDTFCWEIFENERSKDSVPREVRLGMIAFHEHQPFCVNINVSGSTRQKHRHQKSTQGKRWFYPPNFDDIGRHVLQDVMVENLVNKQNLLIRDIAASRETERNTVNLIDISDIGGVAGSEIDGGGLITDSLDDAASLYY
ncbi:hypothetical protein BDR22DRAFT_889176 [Usnea florida]